MIVEREQSALRREPEPTFSHRALIVATLFGVAILVALGTWQIARLHWKEAIVAQIESRRTAPVTSLPPESAWASLHADDYEYLHVALVGSYQPGATAQIYRSGAPNAPGEGPGYLFMTPLRLPDGAVVLVNRGFVPVAQIDAAYASLPEGAVSVTGLMRSPESRNAFTPDDAPARGIWYTRDTRAIAAQFRLERAAPFSIDADADPKRTGWPRAGTTVIDIPNNHLSYALTWYGLALALIGVAVAYLVKARRRP